MQPDTAPSASSDLDLFGPNFQDNPPAVYERRARADPDHLRYNASFMVRGLLTLPVRVRRRPAA